jgi:hypothetical protein
MALDNIYPGAIFNNGVSFSAANTTSLKVLVPQSPAGGLTNNNALLQGGMRVEDVTAASSDSVARNLQFYESPMATLYAGMGTLVISSQNVLTRTAGSWLSDGPEGTGYAVGDQICLQGSVTAANNGATGIVTAVTATALTVNGTPFTNDTETTGFAVYKIVAKTNVPVVASAGTSGTIANVACLGAYQSQERSIDQLGIDLGANGAILVGMAATISALPALVQVRATGRLY